jgi:hypothetical protein
VDDGRLIVLDRYLSHEEINACCAAGNLIATPYRPHPHPSAIVLYAASAGKMVLAVNNGWFAYGAEVLTGPAVRGPKQSAKVLDPALHEAETFMGKSEYAPPLRKRRGRSEKVAPQKSNDAITPAHFHFLRYTQPEWSVVS